MVFNFNQVDAMTFKLTESLRIELKQAAGSALKPQQLDPKQHVFYPQGKSTVAQGYTSC